MAKNERAKYTAVYNLTVEVPIYAASIEEARHKADRLGDDEDEVVLKLMESDTSVDAVTCTDVWEDVRTD